MIFTQQSNSNEMSETQAAYSAINQSLINFKVTTPDMIYIHGDPDDDGNTVFGALTCATYKAISCFAGSRKALI